MTLLSVNVNKIALLRNSRGGDFPCVLDFVKACLALGVRGITVHPRPDERHVRRRDVHVLAEFLASLEGVEFNIEGFPSDQFLDLVTAVRPNQCTLVPDAPGQLTSDHGWDVGPNRTLLARVTARLREAGIRSSLFLDPDPEAVGKVAALGADRIELYTEDYARAFGTADEDAVWARYRSAAASAREAGLGINAGHDLNLANLPRFLEIPGILEVSIGHALVVECLYQGIEAVIGKYLAITRRNP